MDTKTTNESELKEELEARLAHVKCQNKNKFMYGSLEPQCTCKVKGCQAYLGAKNAITKLKEPTQELMELREVLQEAATTDLMGKDKLWAYFLYESCAPNLIKLLAREKSHDPQYLDVVAGVLKAFLSIYLVELRNKRYNFEFTMAMSWVFNPSCSLHQQHF